MLKQQQQPRKRLSLLVAIFLAVATISSIIFAVEAGGAGTTTTNNNNNNAKNCPPVPTVADLDIARYASKPWYVQAQLPNRYQPVENLFFVCSVCSKFWKSAHFPFFFSKYCHRQSMRSNVMASVAGQTFLAKIPKQLKQCVLLGFFLGSVFSKFWKLGFHLLNLL